MADLSNVNVPGTIEYLICQILSNRKNVGCLYDAFDRASEQRSQGLIDFFLFKYTGFGQKFYNTIDLIRLGNESVASPLSTFFADLNLDNIVRIFLATRNNIGSIYCARSAGLEQKFFSRTRFFIFTNPFPEFIPTDPVSIRISQCEILNIDKECGNQPAANIFASLTN